MHNPYAVHTWIMHDPLIFHTQSISMSYMIHAEFINFHSYSLSVSCMIRTGSIKIVSVAHIFVMHDSHLFHVWIMHVPYTKVATFHIWKRTFFLHNPCSNPYRVFHAWIMHGFSCVIHIWSFSMGFTYESHPHNYIIQRQPLGYVVHAIDVGLCMDGRD